MHPVRFDKPEQLAPSADLATDCWLMLGWYHMQSVLLQANWTLAAAVNEHVNFTRALNAVIGRSFDFNKTQSDKRIPLTTLHSNQTLKANRSNSVSLGVLIRASSQASMQHDQCRQRGDAWASLEACMR